VRNINVTLFSPATKCTRMYKRLFTWLIMLYTSVDLPSKCLDLAHTIKESGSNCSLLGLFRYRSLIAVSCCLEV
jgi:hypothetical protein